MPPARRLRHGYQVRFDEADATGRLRPSGYLRFAQDMAWRHSEIAGFGRDWYTERSLTWLVRNVSLHLVAAVTYGEHITLTTEITGWRHVWARRQGVMRRGGHPDDSDSGEVVAIVDTDWVLLGEDGRPARMPDEIASWLAAEPTFERKRVLIPETPPDATRLVTRVRPLDIDPMAHMNNAAYLDVVDEVLAHLPPAAPDDGPDDSPVGRLYRVGYLQPALPGALLDVAAWRPDTGTIACRICDGGTELTRVLISRPPIG
jgi:acyl-ACP thioesterase